MKLVLAEFLLAMCFERLWEIMISLKLSNEQIRFSKNGVFIDET